MKTIDQIETGVLGKNNAVFVAFHTNPVAIYHGISSIPESEWNRKVALLGVVIRWDGSAGFPGGSVEPNESLVNAAIRECREEVGYSPSPESLELRCTHKLIRSHGGRIHTDLNIHLYTCKVTPARMYDIREKSTTSEHGRAEAAGFNVMHMHGTTVSNLHHMRWAGSGAYELDILMRDVFQSVYL